VAGISLSCVLASHQSQSAALIDDSIQGAPHLVAIVCVEPAVPPA
jgi:hypothetical protein